MGWLMLFPAGLFFFTWNKVRKMSKKWLPWFIAPLLLLLAACCLAASVLGDLFAWAIGGALSWIGGMLPGGITGALIATFVLVILFVGTILDLVDKTPNKFAVTGLILIPLFALIAVGPFASGMRGLTNQVSEVGTASFSSITGG
ncbi:hypothetical protein L3Q67_45105 (plasmid) [Saccharothrix sp. AJ9571]|nr:hypothetical protein L3Q67_45105 [Saccharothrix sp. AJ9571]